MDHVEEKFKQATAYKESGQVVRAKDLLQSLLEDHPNNWKILNELGHVCILLEEFKQAHEAFERAIIIQPDKAGLWNNKGYVLKEMGDLAGAIEATYRAKALSIKSHDTKMSHYNLACYLSLSRKPEQALDHLKLACSDDPSIQEWAREDSDLDPIRKDPRFADVTN